MTNSLTPTLDSIAHYARLIPRDAIEPPEELEDLIYDTPSTPRVDDLDERFEEWIEYEEFALTVAHISCMLNRQGDEQFIDALIAAMMIQRPIVNS